MRPERPVPSGCGQNGPRTVEQCLLAFASRCDPEAGHERTVCGPHARLHGRIPQAGPCSALQRASALSGALPIFAILAAAPA